MATGRIGNRLVNEAKPGRGNLFVWDIDLAGFGLKVTPAGRRMFILQYRIGGRGGRTRRVTIGKHGSPWTAATARAEARRILGEVARGGDPAGEKARARASMTVADLCDFYLEEGCSTKKALTMVSDRSRILRHVKPLLGRKRVEEVTRGDVERFMRDVAAGKTARDEKTGPRGRSIVRGGKGAATRTLGLLGAIFSFAVDRGLREDNPARGVKRWPDRKMNRFLSAAELARLGEALRAAEQEGENPLAVAALRLLALTGCRRGEILGLRREEIDFERGFLRLRDSKTGERTVPLGAPALEVLAGLPRLAGSPYVLASANGGHFVNLKSTWRRICARAGLEGVRVHDLRHSFASVAAGAGDSLIVIGAMLGHRVPSTTQRYAHLSSDPVRMATERTSGSIAAAMNGGDKAEVVEIGTGRRGTPRRRRGKR